MTYEDTVACLHDNCKILYGPSPTPRPAFYRRLALLQELKRLRDAAEALVQCLDLSPLVRTFGNGEKIAFDPKQIYQEFKDHYAYEKELCTPLWR